MTERPIAVLPLAPIDGPYHYLPPAGEPPPPPGAIVEAPFGGRRAVGVVWPEEPATPAPAARLKRLARLYRLPPLPEKLLALIAHVARETVTPLGSCARLAISAPEALEPPSERMGLVLAAEEPSSARLTAGREQALSWLRGLDAQEPMLAREIAEGAGVSEAVARGLAKAGFLESAPIVEKAPPRADPARPGLALSARQESAASVLRDAASAKAHALFLLEGVPGSGKTEVYFEAVAAALKAGRQVLVLLPEIALSAQWLERCAERFGAPPVLWHSLRTPAQRRRAWLRASSDEPLIAVGARSALFLPLPELGLIVVDEEHDQSFKQVDLAPYHARDMAIARARIEAAPIVLASATPAVETVERARREGKSLFLPARHGGAAMPKVALLDLRRDKPARGGFVAPPLLGALEKTLAHGHQALLFLNRRGYAPLTICRACGYRAQCPNCTAWLVVHKLKRRLQCHHCGYSAPEPEHCPECGALDELAPSGPGVERLAEEVQRHFPKARLALATSDTTRGGDKAAALIEAVEAREVDILIGTQMVAKGHHFPHLALVGVIDADIGLSGGDLRASERTFQLLYQVAGRAGREAIGGEAFVQTREPSHPVMRALVDGDKDRFVEAELAERKALHLPPFGRLAALIVAGRDSERVQTHARALREAAPEEPLIDLYGPAPAPLTLLRGRYRERLLIKARPAIDLPAWLRAWLARVKTKAGVRVTVDVDPHSFL